MLLVASTTLLGVVGGFPLPYGPPQMSIQASASGSTVEISSDFRAIGALPKADPALLPQLAGQALLEQLALLDRHALVDFATSNPDVVRQLLLEPPSASQTEQWWHDLPSEARGNLTHSAPEIVGNLPGIPFSARDVANRQFLAQTVATLEEQIDSAMGRGAKTEVDARLSMLHQVEQSLEAGAAEPRRSIISLDTVWPGRAAVVIGNLSTADYVSYLIPGMFFTIEGQVDDWADTAAELYAEQREWLKFLGKTDADSTNKSVATVAWMGYETPNLFNVGSEALADEGALYLNSAMDSLYTERGDNRPFVSLLAHSYGSTAAMKALATGNFDVDAFAVVGSPGSSAQSVDELHVRNRNVFVGEASWDPVIGTAFFGSNPGAPSYGAHRMSVAGGTDLITSDQLSPSFGHNEYFAPGSESLRNMALIGIDKGALVSDGSGHDVERTLAYFDKLI